MLWSLSHLSTLLVLCSVAFAVMARAAVLHHDDTPLTTTGGVGKDVSHASGGKTLSHVLSNASTPQSLLTASAGTSPESHHSAGSPPSSVSSHQHAAQHHRSTSSSVQADDERSKPSSPASTMTSVSRMSSVKAPLPQRSASNMRSSIASAHLRAANRHTGNTLGRALISAPVGLGGMGVSLYGSARETAHGHFAKAGGHLTDALIYKPAATLGMMTGGTLSSCKDVGWQLCKSAWHLGRKASDGISLRMARGGKSGGGGESTEDRTARRERQATKADVSNAKSARDADQARANTGNVWRSMLSTERFPDALRRNMAHGKSTDRSSPINAPLVDHGHSS